MNRGRRVVLVSHCLLNMNAKVEGLARHAGVHPVVQELIDRGAGIVQMPCPELTSHGLKRWGQTFEQYDTPFFREHCRRLAEEVAAQVEEYVRCGYDVGPVIGVQASPSCGVTERTSGPSGGHFDDEQTAELRAKSRRVDGSGVFMREIAARLEPHGIAFCWIDDADPESDTARVAAAMDGGA